MTWSGSLHRALAAAAFTLAAQAGVRAQDVTPPPTRAAAIEQSQSAKATQLHPFEPNKVEAFLDNLEARGPA